MTFDYFRRSPRGRFSPEGDPSAIPQEYQVGRDMIQPYGFIEDGVVKADQIAAGEIHVGHMMGQPAGNLVPNGNFEQIGDVVVDTYGDSPPGWTLHSVDARITDDVKHGGGYSLHLRHVGSTRDTTGTPFPVVGGRRYNLSVWVRGGATNVGNGQTIIILRETDASGATTATTFLTVNPGASGVFNESTLSHVMAATTVSCQVDVRSNGSNGDFSQVDDISLHQADLSGDWSSGDVLINEDGVAVTDGKITVTNGSSVVIIDGTSNMLKVAAEGSEQVVFGAAGTTTTEDVTLSSLTYSFSPIILFHYGPGLSPGQRSVDRELLPLIGVNAATGAIQYAIKGKSRLDSSDHPVMTFTTVNVSSTPPSGPGSYFVRYTVLKEESF